jgi:Fe2+ or Zn2+ uptake regulation protein
MFMKDTAHIQLLKKLNLKVTQARLAILEILQHEKPLDVTEIAYQLVKRKVATDQVTIYRILDVFCEKKVAQRIQFQEDKFRYELITNDHHHLICQKCGEVQDLSSCPVTKLEAEIYTKQKFLVREHSLEFFGLCLHCQQT